MRFLRSRLRAPVSVAVVGTAFTAIMAVSQGWAPALVLAIATVIFAVGIYAWSGKDTDVGAVMGHRADERQAGIRIKVSALQGQVMTVAAAIVFLVAVIGKATVWPKANIWPYETPLILAGLAGMVGWAIYRDRGDGDDADAEQAEPRVPVRPGPLSALEVQELGHANLRFTGTNGGSNLPLLRGPSLNHPAIRDVFSSG
jgi:hypothetical protein